MNELLGKVFNEDCLEGMKRVPSGSVDMILCDLPYGTTACKWDVIIPFGPLWDQYRRVVKPNGAIVLTAAEPFSGLLVASQPKAWKETLIWEKNCASNFLNAKRQHLRIHENIHVFSFGTPCYYPQMQDGKPYVQRRNGRDDSGDCYGAIKKRTDTVNTGKRYPTSVLKFPREVGLHPTQKPVSLFKYLISTYTNPGEVVLDNCMGSGTTAIACIQSGGGRNFIGFEKEPKYWEICQTRIKQTMSLPK